MNVQTFQKYMQERGFRTTEKTAFGMEGAYPVTVTFLGARSWQAVFPVDIPDWKSFYTEIKDSLRGLGSLVYGKSRLTLTMPIKDEDSQAVYSQAIALVLGRLQARGIPALDLCPLCGQWQCDCAAYLRGCYQGTHRACLEKQLSETTEKAEQNAMYGNYVTGFVGALLGMVIGVIPSILTILSMERIFALLYALIPLCIYYGYKLCKGKMNRAALIITIILSLVSPYLIEIILAGYILVSDFSMPLGDAMQALGAALSGGDLWLAMTQESLSSFLFIALGIFIAWRSISQTSRTAVLSAQAVLDTSTPYAGADAAQNPVSPEDTASPFM